MRRYRLMGVTIPYWMATLVCWLF